MLLGLLSLSALAADAQKRPTDDQRGKELYERHCVSCHGATARGDGPATEALVVPVPDLQGQVRADAATIKVVQFGRRAMPAFEASFDSDDARRVLLWMAKVHTAPATPPAEDKQKPAPSEDAQGGDAQGGDAQGGDGPGAEGDGPEENE